VGSNPWRSALLAEARQTLAPPRDHSDGVLPPLLVALTVVTGMADAFSHLVLGHVFVASQTGDVVFFAFALAAAAVTALARARNPRTHGNTPNVGGPRCVLLPCRPTR